MFCAVCQKIRGAAAPPRRQGKTFNKTCSQLSVNGPALRRSCADLASRSSAARSSSRGQGVRGGCHRWRTRSSAPPSPRSVPLPPPPSKLSVRRALALQPLARRPPSPPLSPLSEPLPPSPLESCIDASPFVPTAAPPLPPPLPLPHTRPVTTPPGFKATDRQQHRESGGNGGARGGSSLVKGLDLSTGCLLAQVLRASGAFSQL